MARKIRQNGSLPSRPRDPVEAYARKVVEKQIVAGPLVRLACQRHLNDLEYGSERGLRWDWEAAKKAIEFFPTVLRLTEGEFDGKPFELSEFQVFKTGCLFGWKRRNGARRFRVAYIEEGKGNGKSPWAAGIGLFCLTVDDESGAEVYAAATTRDQAKIMFRDAENMVDTSPSLERRLVKTVNNIAYPARKSFFRAISSEGRQLDGKRIHCALLDEVHEHPTPTVVEKMRAGTKGRRQALIVMITNSGWDRTSVCWAQHEYARKILEGAIENDAYFAFICGLDKGDEWANEAVWLKANPNLGKSITLEYLREQVAEAKGMPSKQNLVRRLNFCEWTESSERWIEAAAWAACGGSFDADDLAGEKCVAALDLSARRDLTSLCLLVDGIDARAYALWWHWLPAHGLREREESEGVPWTMWRDQGILRTTPGAALDRNMVARQIVEIFAKFRPWGLAYDRAKFHEVLSVLNDNGWTGERFTTARRAEIMAYRREHPDDFVFIDWGQGFIDMEPACDALETLIVNQTFRHGDNPIASWCAANAKITFDPSDNRKIIKDSPALVIDSVVSAAMASAARDLGTHDALQPQPEYSMFFV
jgi:phage terminase large subunit-like protein